MENIKQKSENIFYRGQLVYHKKHGWCEFVKIYCEGKAKIISQHSKWVLPLNELSLDGPGPKVRPIIQSKQEIEKARKKKEAQKKKNALKKIFRKIDYKAVCSAREAVRAQQQSRLDHGGSGCESNHRRH